MYSHKIVNDLNGYISFLFPGTPAARMKKVPRSIVKQRSREITALVDSWSDSHVALVGTLQKCTVVDVAADGKLLVGHTKGYIQVLLPKDAPDGSGSIMGCLVEARCLSASRWSIKGEVVRVLYRPDVDESSADSKVISRRDLKNANGLSVSDTKEDVSSISVAQVKSSSIPEGAAEVSNDANSSITGANLATDLIMDSNRYRYSKSDTFVHYFILVSLLVALGASLLSGISILLQ